MPGPGVLPLMPTHIRRWTPWLATPRSSIYCSVGYRSAGVTQRLREAGFTNVSNLQGSIFRWANEGRPVYRDRRRVQAVHPFDARWGQLLTDSLHAYEARRPPIR